MFLKIEMETSKLFAHKIRLPLCTQSSRINLRPPPPQLRASFTKLNDSNNNYNLSNLETGVDLSKPKI